MADTEDRDTEDLATEPGAALRPRRRIGVAVAVAIGMGIVAFIAVLATRSPAVDRQSKSPLLGKPAPEIVGTSLSPVDGESYRLSDRRGRFVIVNFFATWCAPCIREHPELVLVRSAARADRRRRGDQRRVQ